VNEKKARKKKGNQDVLDLARMMTPLPDVAFFIKTIRDFAGSHFFLNKF
jgi:hypothetical protein